MAYRKGYTNSFLCPLCGGWIPGFSIAEKEVWEQEVLDNEKVCDCGQYATIRDGMLACFHRSRVETLRRFREQAAKYRLPDPESRVS